MSLNAYSKHQIRALKVSAIVSAKVITFFYTTSAFRGAHVNNLWGGVGHFGPTLYKNDFGKA